MVLLGSAAGMGVALALTPVIARMFDPATFGFFATLTAVASVFVGVSTFRMEVLAQRSEDEGEARLLIAWAVRAACCWGLVVGVVSAVVVVVLPVSPWWLMTGPLVTAASLQLLGSAVLTRSRRYGDLAAANFFQGAGTGVVQVALGWLGMALAALLAGFALVRLVWLRPLAPWLSPGRRPPALPRRIRRHALMSGSSALVNSCAGQLPVIICTVLFGHGAVGLLAMALRVLVTPLGVVGQAAAAANAGEVGRLLRDGGDGAADLVRRGMRDLLLVGLLPCGLAAATGTWLVPLLLGDDWRLSGVLVAWLSVGALAQFVVAPFSQLLNITGRSRSLLWWDLGRLGLILGVFVVVGLSGGGLTAAVAAYSGALVLLYLVLAWAVLRAVSNATR